MNKMCKILNLELRNLELADSKTNCSGETRK